MLQSGAVVVTLPVPHIDQRRAYEQFDWYGTKSVRFSIVRCGRRWGKTELLGAIACTDVANGKLVGYFAPDYKRMLPFYKFCAKRLLPITVSSSQQSGIITALGGGSLEHWTLNDQHAGRNISVLMTTGTKFRVAIDGEKVPFPTVPYPVNTIIPSLTTS